LNSLLLLDIWIKRQDRLPLFYFAFTTSIFGIFKDPVETRDGSAIDLKILQVVAT